MRDKHRRVVFNNFSIILFSLAAGARACVCVCVWGECRWIDCISEAHCTQSERGLVVVIVVAARLGWLGLAWLNLNLPVRFARGREEEARRVVDTPSFFTLLSFFVVFLFSLFVFFVVVVVVFLILSYRDCRN